VREGSSRGWRLVRSRAEAQALANDGWAVVCLYRNPDPHKPGHAAVVRPSLRGPAAVERDGPETAMAGRHNANAVPMRQAFRSHPDAFDAGEILMFAHESPVTRGLRPAPDARPHPAAAERAAPADAPGHALADVLAANLPAWTGGTGVLDRHRLQPLADDPGISGVLGPSTCTLRTP
jgi:hypothetical protein